MGTFKEYSEFDAIGLKELIDKKEVSISEVHQAARDRIALKNPEINAVVFDMTSLVESQLKDAAPNAPLYGIPYLLKDLGSAYKGVPFSHGSKLFKNYIPDYDDTLVSRYKKAGLICFGKANTPEFGLKGTTEPELFGPCRNPWNTSYSTGGSSGGSGAAVASGMVPIASAGDGGGSIRIPASHCGLFGLKPSRGRMPSGPKEGDAWQGATTHHILSRTVRDSALVMDLSHGMDKGSRAYATPYNGSYLKSLELPVKKLKIAFNLESPIGMGVHQDNVDAVKIALKLLEELGHEVVEARPPIDGMELAISYLTMYMGEVQAGLMEAEKLLGKKVRRSDVELSTWLLYKLGQATSAGEFVLAIKYWDSLARIMATFFDTYDLYLTPTSAFPPAKIGALDLKPIQELLIQFLTSTGATKILKASGKHMEIALDNLKLTPFTQLANLSGLPSVSIPMHKSSQNLPLGVMFNAPFGNEEILFQLGRQIEEAKPWLFIN